jgi:hypothetical protein
MEPVISTISMAAVARLFAIFRGVAGKNSDLKATLAGITRTTAITATGTALGGAVAGPPGALLLGAGAALFSYFTSPDYKSIPEVLSNMSEKEQKVFIERAYKIAWESFRLDLLQAVVDLIPAEVMKYILEQTLEGLKFTLSGTRTAKPQNFNPQKCYY